MLRPVTWLTVLLAPWRNAGPVRDALVTVERAVTVTIPNHLAQMEALMAADRDLLADIAAGLTALATPVSELIASEAALRARVTELEGEAAADEAGDLAAAGAVKVAFDGIADKFRAEPDVPDVEPLPEPEPPTDPAPPSA